MFRTWNANMILLTKILSYPFPKDSKESKQNLSEIIEKARATSPYKKCLKNQLHE